MLEHLRSLPDKEALSVIRRLRTTPDVGVVLTHIRNTFPQQHPSLHHTARAILPSTESAIESELTIRYQLVYRILDPFDSQAVDVSLFDDVLHHSLPDTIPSEATTPTLNSLTPVTHTATSTSTSTSSPYTSFFDSNTITPSMLSHDAESPPSNSTYQHLLLCDPILNHLDVRFWTKVPITNEFAARVISRYLELDHPIFGFFDADLFLSDLVNKRTDYCSPFLVSSLLCFACVSTLNCFVVHGSNSSSYVSLARISNCRRL